MHRVYDNPKAYDLAFGYRDYPQETRKLIDWYKESTGQDEPPGSLLELACGPARYPIESFSDVVWTAESAENKVSVRWGTDGSYEYAYVEAAIDGNEIEIEEKAPMRKWLTGEIIVAAHAAELTLSAHYSDLTADSTEKVAALSWNEL